MFVVCLMSPSFDYYVTHWLNGTKWLPYSSFSNVLAKLDYLDYLSIQIDQKERLDYQVDYNRQMKLFRQIVLYYIIQIYLSRLEGEIQFQRNYIIRQISLFKQTGRLYYKIDQTGRLGYLNKQVDQIIKQIRQVDQII